MLHTFYASSNFLTHVENLLFENCNNFSVLSIFKYNPDTNDKSIINLSKISIQ